MKAPFLKYLMFKGDYQIKTNFPDGAIGGVLKILKKEAIFPLFKSPAISQRWVPISHLQQ